AVTRLAPDEDLAAAIHGSAIPRPHLRDGLTQLYAAGNRLHGWNWITIARAKLQATWQAWREHGEAIRVRRQAGIREGALMGTLWVTLIAALATFLRRPLGKDWLEVPFFVPYAAAGIGVLFGALLGWFTAVAAAKHAVLHGEGRWGRALACNLGILLGTLA